MLEQPDLFGSAEEETMRQMRAAVEDPGARLRVYAHDHAYVDAGPAWPVVYPDVPAEQMWTDGNGPSEYGYGGHGLPDLDPFVGDQVMPSHPLDTLVVPRDRTQVVNDIDVVENRPGSAPPQAHTSSGGCRRL